MRHQPVISITPRRGNASASAGTSDAPPRRRFRRSNLAPRVQGEGRDGTGHNAATRTKEETMAHHPGAIYLLSDGQIASGGHPVCYQTHTAHPQTPLSPDADNDGL